MALLMNDTYIQYYHLYAIHSTLLDGTYLMNPVYQAIKLWEVTVIQHSDSVLINGLQIFVFT